MSEPRIVYNPDAFDDFLHYPPSLPIMSLPQASKEISHNPGKNSVTAPTDKAAMQADVDRKVRFSFSSFSGREDGTD